MAASARRTRHGNGIAARCESDQLAFDEGSVIGFKNNQARREQFALGHDDDIEAWRDVISTENLSNQTFSTIPGNRATKALRRGDAQTTNGKSIWLRKQRVVAAWDTAAMLVDVLEVGVSADPLVRAELQTANRC
jgi:hypothetical protein